MAEKEEEANTISANATSPYMAVVADPYTEGPINFSSQWICSWDQIGRYGPRVDTFWNDANGALIGLAINLIPH